MREMLLGTFLRHFQYMVLQYQTHGLPLHANVYEVPAIYLKGIAQRDAVL